MLDTYTFESISMDLSYSLWELIPRRVSGLVQDLSIFIGVVGAGFTNNICF